MMRPGYKMLMRVLGEAILGGTLGKREKTLAKALYGDMKREEPIYPGWEPVGKATAMTPGLFSPLPPPPSPAEIREKVVAPAAAAKSISRKTVDHAKDSAGYDGQDPL